MNYKSYKVLGIMSGTSLDGVDISLIKTDGKIVRRLNKNYYKKFSSDTFNCINELIKNNTQKFKDTEQLKYTENLVTNEYIKSIEESGLIDECDIIGLHGQTIYHSPKYGKTIQIGDAITIANYFKKKIVYNFRFNDIFNGGQGAPLAPIYHKSIIEELNLELPACIINLGGIANISYWDGRELIGFDTGPANYLMDKFMRTKFNASYDKNGKIASTGKINFKVFSQLMKDPFFKRKFPKSLDVKYFDKFFDTNIISKINDFDLITTLCEFTVSTIASSINMLPKKPKVIICCGGGANNNYLIYRLKKKLCCKIYKINQFNLSIDYLEAELIAYLAARSINGLPITFPKTTGVSKPLSGGKIFFPQS